MKTPPFLKDFIDLFFPRLCPVCQRALNRNEKTFAPPVCIDYRAPVITSTRSARWHNFFSEKFPLKNVRHFSFSPRRATPGNSYTTSNTTEENNAVSP